MSIIFSRRRLLVSAASLLAARCSQSPSPSPEGSLRLPTEPPGTSTPISPADYAQQIGTGFATSWFKVVDPLRDYRRDTLRSLRTRGFSNVRLRCRADVHGFAGNQINWDSINRFLDVLVTVVDDCLAENIVPVVSWIHHEAESRASSGDGERYVAWWTAVAQRLRNRSHRLSFNLFTEIGDGALRDNINRYNDWTRRVVAAIRSTGGLNATRILVLGAPGKTARSLAHIDPTIYRSDTFMMAEWHLFASGPNHDGGQKEWRGPHDPQSRDNVNLPIGEALAFTERSGLRTYLGAWMPMDNAEGTLTQDEVESFSTYFPTQLRGAGIPWSLNEVAHFYDEASATWRASSTHGGRAIRVDQALARVIGAR
jgi:hypothetical protein